MLQPIAPPPVRGSLLAAGGGETGPPADLTLPARGAVAPSGGEERYRVPADELGEVWASDSEEMMDLRRRIDHQAELRARAGAIVVTQLQEEPRSEADAVRRRGYTQRSPRAHVGGQLSAGHGTHQQLTTTGICARQHERGTLLLHR